MSTEVIAVTLGIASIGAVLAWYGVTIRRLWLEIRAALDRKTVSNELPERLAELEELVESIRQSVKRLHSRAGMRELRERSGANGRAPDWRTNPEAYRAAMERRLGISQARRAPPEDDE